MKPFLITFLLGVYLCGVAFTYWMSKEGLDMDASPEWQKRGAPALIAVIWPIPATVAGVMAIKERIFG